MTDEEMRIAIAEACGWQFLSPAPAQTKYEVAEGIERTYGVRPDSQSGVAEELPNYPKDLNAMHEAKKILKNLTPFRSDHRNNQPTIFIREAMKILGIECSNFKGMSYLTADQDFQLGNMEARQEAEAFLRTVGKWKD